MRQVSISGTDLFYAEEGHGKSLVFIPGLGATHGMFGPQVDAFRASYRLLLPDLRGTGQSGRLTGPIGTVLDRQCDDLADLLDQLGLPEVVMIGVSYGGTVALHFALRHGDRLAGLVAVDTFADLRIARPMEALLLAGSYLTLWTYYLPRPILVASARLFYRRWPVARRVIPALMDGFRPTEAVLQSLAMCLVDDIRYLGQVRCPALGIVGDATRTGVRLLERAMAAIAGSRLEIVRDSFDPTNLCQPGEFNRLLAGFLDQVGW
jgi:pimeloyl-ACP methyl ester carboxylesterase